jgi:hypothetical protein
MQVGDTVRLIALGARTPRIGIVLKRWVSVGREYARVATTDGIINVYTARRLEVICKSET